MPNNVARKLIQLLSESRIDRYREMFPSAKKIGISEEGKEVYDYLKEVYDSLVAEAIEKLKREDRIVWYLRVVITKLLLRGQSWSMDTAVENSELYSAAASRATNAQGGWTLNTSYSDLMDNLSHFLDLPCNKIQSYVFNKQSPDEILQYFSSEEQKWLLKRKRFIGSDQSVGAEKIVEFNNGWAWYNLHTDGCEAEGKAMGHCSTGGEQGDINLSLREPHKLDGKQGFKPHLTFIWNKDSGLLSEMKGPANSKPGPEYHKYIIPLLKHRMIKGINPNLSMGWLSENNFKFLDLTPEQQDELYSLKPALAPRSFMLRKEGLTQKSVGLINEVFNKYGLPNVSLLPEEDASSDTMVNLLDLGSVESAILSLYSGKNSPLVSEMTLHRQGRLFYDEIVPATNMKLIGSTVFWHWHRDKGFRDTLRSEFGKDFVIADMFDREQEDPTELPVLKFLQLATRLSFPEKNVKEFEKSVESWIDGLHIEYEKINFYVMFNSNDLDSPIFQRTCFLGIDFKSVLELIDSGQKLSSLKSRSSYDSLQAYGSVVYQGRHKRWEDVSDIPSILDMELFESLIDDYLQDVLDNGFDAVIEGKPLKNWLEKKVDIS